MIRNIVFDMGNVLIHWQPNIFLDQLNVAEEDRPRLTREVFGRVEWIQLDRGVISFEEAAAAMCARLPRHLHGVARTLVFGWWKRPLCPVEGMAGLIQQLKESGYGIYLLSNANVDLPQYFHRIPGSEYFDGRIVSADWRLLKPQPELYRVLLREYNLLAEECFFVDDLNINVEAAMLVGMSGAVFHGTDELRRELLQAGVPALPGVRQRQ